MTKQEEIQKLKEEKDAVILAHYYVRPEIQEIADYIGDSYFLSKKAVERFGKVPGHVVARHDDAHGRMVSHSSSP